MPCNLPVVGQGTFASTSPENGSQWGLRIDHMFGSKDRLYGSFLKTHQYQNAINPFPDFNQPVTVGSTLVNIDETHIFSPNLLNEVTFSYIRSIGDAQVLHPEVPFINVIGVSVADRNVYPDYAVSTARQISGIVAVVPPNLPISN